MLEKPHYLGHRKRLKEKFLKNSASSFEDYELLEILLFFGHSRKDVKPIAKRLLAEFGNINSIINADEKILKNIDGINDNILASFKLIREIVSRSHRDKINNKPVIEGWKPLISYCQAQMMGLQKEQLRVLFLNKKHHLIADELQHQGSIENIKIDIKAILQKALDLSAYGLILVHNHPTSDTRPSRADLENTNKIIEALKIVDVKVYDHLIFGQDGNCYSFKNEGLIT